MKRILRTVLTAGLPFGLALGVFFWVKTGSPGGGLAGGVLSGVLFGGLLGLFAEVQGRRMRVQGDRFEGELLLHQGPANHRRGVEVRGGWLILTTGRLSFRSHGKNLQNAGLDLPLDGLRGVEPSRSFGIVPNGLRVIGANGTENRFVVSERGLWLERIAAALAARPR